ncbi:MAG: right-handed parallel beta-helix repeat-containing protein [Methanomassiliicoccales archaeon]|nr:MAG: right-handed parallel beta-helix repeat-containing protein [Methanomassiliicoccales archaeon]
MNEIRGNNQWAINKKIVSWILIVMLAFSGLAVLLPMSSDEAEGYSMPSGVSWGMDDLVSNSSGAVTQGPTGPDVYLVHDDIVITANSSLYVYPGQMLYFDINTSFQVYGYLGAEGDNSSGITFTSNATNPSYGDWDGITFYYGAGDIDYVTISYAEEGIRLFGTPLTITNSVFSYNVWGVHVYHSEVGIAYNTFQENGILIHPDPYYSVGGGIYIENDSYGNVHGNDFISNIGGVRVWLAYLNVNNNLFANNSVYGIYCEEGGYYQTYLTIQENDIEHNENYGIYVILGYGATIQDNNITYNRVGIYISGESEGSPGGGWGGIYDNYIAHNEENGIECYGQGYLTDMGVSINGNEILSNGLCGIYCHNSAPYIYNNDINNNWYGVYSFNSTVDISVSTFDTNRYAVYVILTELDIVNSEIMSSNAYDFFLENDSYITSLNTTFDDNAVSFTDDLSVLEVQWYLHILVINDSGPVPSADVAVSDNENGTWSQDYLTNAYGRVNWITVIEYIRDSLDWVYHTPHNITASKGPETGYADPFMDMSKLVVVDLSPGPEPPNQPPVADAGEDQLVNEDDIVEFDGSGSYDPDGVIVNYTWDFGDGNFGYGVSPTHVYGTPGIYEVILTVKDDDDATDSDICIITVDDIAAPSLPTDLNAELVSGSLTDVKLTWTASEDDGAGYDDVAGYTVYKSSTGIYGDYEFEAWVWAQKIPGYRYEWTDEGAGDEDWNNYFYIVRANDTSDNEEQNENKVGKFASYLDEGWNMMSVPLVQKDTSREVVLQTLGNNYMTVQGYHAGKSRPWLHWHRNKPNYFNDVIEIDHKNGYYIDMIVPDYLVTAGKVATQVEISIETGWNLVGYPCLTELLRDDALSSIAGNYNMVERYDTTKDKEVRLGPNDYMEPGLGYWIHATADCVWTLTN